MTTLTAEEIREYTGVCVADAQGNLAPLEDPQVVHVMVIDSDHYDVVMKLRAREEQTEARLAADTEIVEDQLLEFVRNYLSGSPNTMLHFLVEIPPRCSKSTIAAIHNGFARHECTVYFRYGRWVV